MSDRMRARILPLDLIQEVEEYVSSELSNAVKWDNRELFDTSGVWSLHQLAAAIYARGWSDGERAESERAGYERRRPVAPVEHQPGEQP